MANRKEDERNERVIRNLLKLPDNRRCINCNSLGPQYVCTNFWTFICTNCSGIHREFTHRAKSISMAKFTSQEVGALQGGGNASAKEIYLKEWDPQRQSLPDGSKVEKLRDFIKHVYVERRYTGERSSDKPPRAKMGESDDINETRRMDNNQSGSRSPPRDDTNECRYGDRSSPGGRSPGYDQGNRPYSDHKRIPARTDVVNDWRREDRFGNGRRSEDNRLSDGSSGVDSRSPDHQRDLDASSPPMVRPVREILGENVIPLRVIEPPKPNGASRTQRTASSSSLASSNGNPAEVKVETSLIDFDDAPEPPVPAAMPQPQQLATGMPVAQTAPNAGDNWANFDSASEVKGSQAQVSANPLESVLSELAVPASNHGHLTGGGPASIGSFGLPFGTVAPPAAATFPSGAPASIPGLMQTQTIPGGNSFGNAVTQGQWIQSQPHYIFPGMGGQPPSQHSVPAAVRPSSTQWNPLIASNSQGLPSAVSQPVIRPTLEGVSEKGAQNSYAEVKSSGRKPLPEDIFAVNYPLYSAPAPGWHAGPPHGMGFPMQYNMHMPPPAFPQSSKSTNPFDVNSDPSPVPAPAAAPMFPSMTSLGGALPMVHAPGGPHRTSSLGAPASNPPAMLPHAQSFPTMMPSNSYMGQQLPGNVPSRPHGQLNFGLEGAAFGQISNQHLGGLQLGPTAPNTYSSMGGNPFG